MHRRDDCDQAVAKDYRVFMGTYERFAIQIRFLFKKSVRVDNAILAASHGSADDGK
jgi:hypothetical protein